MRGELKKVNKDLESNAGYLLNKMNIRHNNVDGEKAIEYVKNLTNEELEEWYDEPYQVLLLCFLEHDNIERNKKFEIFGKSESLVVLIIIRLLICEKEIVFYSLNLNKKQEIIKKCGKSCFL